MKKTEDQTSWTLLQFFLVKQAVSYLLTGFTKTWSSSFFLFSYKPKQLKITADADSCRRPRPTSNGDRTFFDNFRTVSSFTRGSTSD